MNLQLLKDIKKLRKIHHLSQKELAASAGVSQSLIAKIEASKVDPTYSKAKQIFDALEQLQESEEIKAQTLMSKKVLFAQINDPIKEIIKTMKGKCISQMPVLSHGKVCGIITESSLLKNIFEQNINQLRAGDVMEEAPPMVSVQTGFRTLSTLLKDNSIVLVMKKGDVKGIVSKSDLLGKV